ncbi:MAG TPA: ABC transporter permease [Terriglobia bacterium]|nr:ABC transporter permease [Terriglobia bacterium]
MLRKDLWFGIRLLRKDVRFTILVMLTLALAIGATSAVFSVVNAVLLRPLPFPDADRLTMIWKNNPAQGYPIYYMSPPDFVDFKDQNKVFGRLAAFVPEQLSLTSQGDPEELYAVYVSPALFSLLKAKAMAGRVLIDDDATPGHDHIALLGYGLWQSRFGSDRAVLGKSLTLDGAPYVVVGIMPPGFDFPPFFDLQGGFHSAPPDVWVPLDLKAPKVLGVDATYRGALFLEVLAQLRPGVSISQSESDLATINAHLEQEYPLTNKGWGVTVVSLRTQFSGKARPALLILMGAVGFVLLIGCANAANLLLARAVTRQREVAIRLTLGASRLRLIRQLLTESVLLALGGGALGLALADGAMRLLVAVSPPTIPRIGESSLDASVLAFTLLVAVLAGLIFGLAPAFQASRGNLSEALKEGSQAAAGGFERLRLRNLLVIAEIALAFVLLICAGLMLKSFARLRAVNPGFDPHNLLTALIQLSDIRYPDPARRQDFFKQVLARAQTIPDVQSAAGIDAPPWSEMVGSWTFNIEGRPLVPTAECPIAEPHVVSPNFFRTAGIPLLKGRIFEPTDDAQHPGVILINETLARRFFPNENPIGKRINMIDAPAPPAWLTIIGVVGDVRYDSLDAAAGLDIYASYLQPYPQLASSHMTLMLRLASNPASVVPGVRRAVESVDKDQPITAVKTMDDYRDASVSRQRLAMVMLGVFAGLALILAVLGTYGVISYSVGQRTREIGVRMALGAQPGDVLKLILLQGALLALVGSAIGLIAAFGLTRLMSSLLYGVGSSDPATFTIVLVLLTVAALAATYWPARAATRMAPTAALRHE